MTTTFVPTPTTVPAPTDPNATNQSRTRSGAKLWRTGALAGVVASGATAAVAALASAADVSLKVSGEAIPVVGFAQLTFVAAVIGTIIAIALSHRANRPRRTFIRTTVALTLGSIVPDVLADAHTSTRLTLALTHVVAAAIVIPVLASRLQD